MIWCQTHFKVRILAIESQIPRNCVRNTGPSHIGNIIAGGTSFFRHFPFIMATISLTIVTQRSNMKHVVNCPSSGRMISTLQVDSDIACIYVRVRACAFFLRTFHTMSLLFEILEVWRNLEMCVCARVWYVNVLCTRICISESHENLPIRVWMQSK